MPTVGADGVGGGVIIAFAVIFIPKNDAGNELLPFAFSAVTPKQKIPVPNKL
jgi:hypothetical protein